MPQQKPHTGLAWDLAAIVAVGGALVVVTGVALIARSAASASAEAAAAPWDLAVACAAGGAVVVAFLVLLVQVNALGKQVERAEQTAMSGDAARQAAGAERERGALRAYSVRADLVGGAELAGVDAARAFHDEQLPTLCGGQPEAAAAAYRTGMWLVLAPSDGGDQLLNDVASGAVRYLLLGGATCRVVHGARALEQRRLGKVRVSRALALAPAYDATVTPSGGAACSLLGAVLPAVCGAAAAGAPSAGGPFQQLRDRVGKSTQREMALVAWGWA